MDGLEKLNLEEFMQLVSGSDEFVDEGLDLLTDEEIIALEVKRYRDRCQQRFLQGIPQTIRDGINQIVLNKPEYAVYAMRNNWSGKPHYTRGCLLCSPPGRGKTVAACWAALRMIEIYGQPASFIHLPTYANYIGLGMDSSKTWERAVKIEERVDDDDRIIVLDDLGRERDSQATRDRSALLIDCLWRRNARCIITTNMRSTEIIDRYGDYISSRLLDRRWMTLVVCMGYDHRTESAA